MKGKSEDEEEEEKNGMGCILKLFFWFFLDKGNFVIKKKRMRGLVKGDGIISLSLFFLLLHSL